MSAQCTICLEPSVAHVNPDIFGADGASLNPARWFQDLETVGKMRNHILAVSPHTQPPLLAQQPAHAIVVFAWRTHKSRLVRSRTSSSSPHSQTFHTHWIHFALASLSDTFSIKQ